MTTAKISQIATEVTAAPNDNDMVEVERAADGVSYFAKFSNFIKGVITVARTVSAAWTFTAKSLHTAGIGIRDSANDHTITLNTASDEAADRSITIPALGGNVTLSFLDLAQTFTAQKVFETGAAGASPVIYRQTGGVAGTDEVQIAHDGTNALINVKSGGLNIDSPGGPVVAQVFQASLSMTSASYSIASFGNFFGYGGFAEFSCNNGYFSSTVPIEFVQVADVRTPATNSANIGAEDVAGTAEMIVSDEAGTETQISEHRSDGPNWLYDDVAVTGMLDRVEYDRQRYLGVHRYCNLSRERRLRAAGTPITTAPGLPTTCEFVETFAQWHVRCPEKAHIQQRDWDADQLAKQAAYDAARQNEVEQAAKVQADHVKALAAYSALSAAEKAKRSAPVLQLPPVREAKDIRKPRPEWLAAKD